MITLITGVPGHGKTLYAVHLIKQITDKNKKLENLPTEEWKPDDRIRPVYTDIDGIDHEKLGTHPIPESYDWRDTPDGSVVVYDECQQHFGPDNHGRAKDTRISDLEIHRHSGHDIIFITQRERLIHAHIRDLVGSHYHIQRFGGTKRATIFHREEVIKTQSRSLLNTLDKEGWAYPQELFEYYQSATIHTHKRRLPKWLVGAGFQLLMLIILACVSVYYAIGFFSGDSVTTIIAPEEQQQEEKSSAFMPDISSQIVQHHPPQQVSAPVPPPVQYTGCVVFKNDTQCQCYTTKGYLDENLKFSQCMRIANRPNLSFRPMEMEEGRKKRREEARKVAAMARPVEPPAPAPPTITYDF
jgi:zona occludens toxin (predicted ATPase)